MNSVVLPGAVRSDEAGDEPGVGVDVDLVEREVTAEADGDAAGTRASATQRTSASPSLRVELGDVLGSERAVDADPLERHVGEVDARGRFRLGRRLGPATPATRVKPINATTPPTTNHHAPMSAMSTIA